MNFDEFLGPKTTIVELRARSRWQAIDELLDHLVAVQKIKAEDKDAIAACVRQRESLASTGIGSGAAIPHASTDLVSDVVVAVGRSREGIPFEAVDGKPAHTVVLFLVPKNQFQKHVNTLANIAKLLPLLKRAP